MFSDRLHRITIEPGKCGGQPCIRGKRIRVTDILELYFKLSQNLLYGCFVLRCSEG
ncbi:MAG: DUF433 domain-containing protein [Candidatus Competibacteraceae bacterium]|nr:MAG: DUF433 domain-containing protein [Candidatus Competibacteraceae bacterium]